MSEESGDPILEVELEEEEEADVLDTWLNDLEVIIFDPPRLICDHEVFAAHNVGGELVLYTSDDLKGHIVDVSKGLKKKPPEGATIQSIKKGT